MEKEGLPEPQGWGTQKQLEPCLPGPGPMEGGPLLHQDPAGT